jgi:hypothetical protein
MKTMIYPLFFLFLVFYNTSIAQFKINQYGNIGIGIEPHLSYKVLIKGDFALTTYPEIPHPLLTYTEFRIKVGNGLPGAEFGTPTKKIAVWASEVGYNELYASVYYTASDKRLKTNTLKLNDGLETVLQLKPYSFYLKDTIGALVSSEKKSFGFLAQDIAEILPSITDTCKGIMLIDYQQLIPYLVAAIQEQNLMIQKLLSVNELVVELKNVNSEEKTIELAQKPKTIVLNQNVPNPFKEKTIINYTIPEDAKDAFIIFYDVQGQVLKNLPLHDGGSGNIIVYGSDLSSGIYIYTLVVDGEIRETKKMTKSE